MTPKVIVRLGALLAAAGLMLQPGFGQGTIRERDDRTTDGRRRASGRPRAAAEPLPATAPGSHRFPRHADRPSRRSSSNNSSSSRCSSHLLSGRVMMEDGTPAAESVVIERVCSGDRTSGRLHRQQGLFFHPVGRAE